MHGLSAKKNYSFNHYATTKTTWLYVNNYSLSFNGTDEYLEGLTTIPSGSKLRTVNLTTITISAWFNTTYSSGGIRYIYCIWTGTDRWLAISINSSGAPILRLKNSGGDASLVSSVSGYNDGSWHHVLGTWDGSNASIYVDGTNRGSASKGGVLNDSGYIFDSIRIGRILGSYTGGYFPGKLDELAIWSTALSTDQISEVYNGGTPKSLLTISGPYLGHYIRCGDGAENASKLTIYDSHEGQYPVDMGMTNMDISNYSTDTA